MKRIFTIYATFVLLLQSLLPGAQAQPGFDMPQRQGEVTTITLWTSEIHGDRLAVINYLANVFGALEGDVEVEVVSVDENELVNKLSSAHGCDESPQLVSTGSELIVALGEKGFLDTASANDFIGSIGKQRFYSGALQLLSMPKNKGYYGVPYHGWVQGIWYRADWFKEAGLAPPETWEAMLAAARHFYAPERGQYGILVGTMDDQYAEQVFTQLARSNGAKMFSPDGQLIFNSPAMVETLEQYILLSAFTPYGPQTWRARDFYLQGKLAMFFYSTFIMDDLALEGVATNSLTGEHFKELRGAKFDPELARNTRLAPLIRNKDTAGYGMINGFGMLTGCPEKKADAVRRFLKFLYEPGQYVEWLHMAPGGMLPVLRDTAESESFMRDPLGVFRRYGRPKVREILSGLENISNFGTVEGRRFPQASVFYAERIIPRMITKAISGDITPAQAVAWAEAEMLQIQKSY